jgi:phosphohistidine phosphatase
MPAQLVLVRHAKAEREGPSDAERPLASRGRADAAAIGRWLTSHGIAPDRVVLSPTLRTRETWQLTGIDTPPVYLDERIYDNTIEDLLAVVRDTPPDVRTLLAVGHNPSMGSLASLWAPQLSEFRTGAVAVFELDDWSSAGRLTMSATPRG